MSRSENPVDLVSYLKTKPNLFLVGASNDPQKYGNRIFRVMRSKGYPVIPVNHRAKEIESVTSYQDLSAALEDHSPGLVVYVVPPPITLKSLKEAKRLGLTRIWIQPGAGDPEVDRYLEDHQFDYMHSCVMVEG